MADTAMYPSYKNLDPFIDVERLRSLDHYLTERLSRRVAQEKEDTAFYTGPFQLGERAPQLPGSRMVYLSRSSRPDNYYDLDDPTVWHPSEDAGEFSQLMEFIETLPFQSRGRMLIIYDGSGRAVTAHRDHDSQELCHEFVWFRTNFSKPFFMLDAASGEKLYVDSHSAWFDTVNQYHGADASDGLSFSIRVDGAFTEEFRSRIPYPLINRAAAPTHWAMAA